MVVGNDGSGLGVLEAILVKDRGIVTTSGGMDDEDIDEERKKILLLNLEVLHV
jgi:hypothetical protein